MDHPQSFTQKLLHILASPGTAAMQSWCPSTTGERDGGSEGCALKVTFAGERERHQKSSVGSVCVGGVCSHSDIQHLETQRQLVQKYK